MFGAEGNSEVGRQLGVADVEVFVTTVLPTLNQATLDGELSMGEHLARTQTALGGIADVPSRLNACGRAALEPLLGMVGLSVDTVAQRSGQPTGHGMRQVPGLDLAILLSAGRMRPPLTAASYWLASTREFTPQPYAQFFRGSVREQVQVCGDANQILRRVADRELALDSAAAPHQLRCAAALHAQAHRSYLTHRKTTEPADFQRFRGWLSPVEMFGTVWTGPNAAALWEMCARDVLAGTADPAYFDYLQDLMPYLTDAEMQTARVDLGRESVMNVVATTLGFADAAAMSTATAFEVTERVAAVGPTVLESLAAFRDLLLHHVHATGAHTGLVKTRLHTRDLSVTTAAIHADAGVSGRSHDHLEQLRLMRRDHPGFVNLKTAVALVLESCELSA